MNYCSTFVASNENKDIEKMMNNVLHIILVVVLLVISR